MHATNRSVKEQTSLVKQKERHFILLHGFCISLKNKTLIEFGQTLNQNWLTPSWALKPVAQKRDEHHTLN